MKTVQEILQSSIEFLESRECQEPRKAAEWMLMDVLGVGRMDLYMEFDRPLEEKEVGKSREMLKRLGRGEPWAYVIGKTDFYHCDILVSPAVLIPRPETEQLVDMIVKELKGEVGVLWDLCCGSGCIGIAIKKALPDLSVILSDISPDACSIAKENAKRNGVEVEVREGDLFAPFEVCDYLVTNPPYIKNGAELPKSVIDFEPKGALFGGEDGLDFYRRIAQEIPPGVKKMWCEVGEDVRKIFSGGEMRKDWYGKDRFFFLSP